MRVVALVSGGKDSCYNMMQCVAEGHQIVALANLHPKDKDELDSYMYQTVGHMGIEKLAEAMELPLYRMETKGISRQTGKQYVPTDDDEVEDLFNLLKWTKKDLNVEAVSVGAILSDYQRIRVENVCNRLNLVSLAYLWRRDQSELLQEMIDSHVFAIIIKVASLGLVPDRHLGKSLRDIQPHLIQMKDKYGLNVCGEGGEYETFTLNCPLFKRKIVVDDMQTVISSLDPVSPVGYINFTKLQLIAKEKSDNVFVKTSLDYLKDINNSEEEKHNKDDKTDAPTTVIAVSDCLLPKTKNHSSFIKTNVGWLWIGGIQGNGRTAHEGIVSALNEFTNILTNHSCPLSSIVQVTLYVRNMSDFAEINEVYLNTINMPNPPTRVCVECPLPIDCQVIMEAIGYHPKSIELENYRQNMHVQGISHWAPANIGPYSQSIKIGNVTFISGQIALIPGTMKIIDGGINIQCNLALRHVSRIASAMGSKNQLRDVVQAICFVTHSSYIAKARFLWEECTTNAIVNYIVVQALPRNGLIEWQVWLHSHNDKFNYEETGCTIGEIIIFSIRRWSKESNCSAIVCFASHSSLSNDKSECTQPFVSITDVKEMIKYTSNKLLNDRHSEDIDDDIDADQNKDNTLYRPSVNLKCFYPIDNVQISNTFAIAINDYQKETSRLINICCTLIPVKSLHNSGTFLSISGIRYG